MMLVLLSVYCDGVNSLVLMTLLVNRISGILAEDMDILNTNSRSGKTDSEPATLHYTNLCLTVYQFLSNALSRSVYINAVRFIERDFYLLFVAIYYRKRFLCRF